MEGQDSRGKYLGDAVYGALDGIVTTFAVVAGVAGASLSSSIVLILGIANLLADGISMAAGNYLSKRSEQEYIAKVREEERKSLEKNPKEHKAHVRRIYALKGFRGPVLSSIVAHITKDKERWADEMVAGELGLHESGASAWKSGLATLAAFVLAGAIPLLSYILAIGFPGIERNSFGAAIILTGAALFLVGSLRSLLIAKRWWRAGLEMLVIGGLAAAVAFVIGNVLSRIV